MWLHVPATPDQVRASDLDRVRVLSICSGVGGLDLGVRLAVPAARTVVYVEREVQAAAVLAARAQDGRLDPGPIWSDLTTFDGRQWRGAVDLAVAGVPCQPVSVAGQRRGQDDDRWLWPEVLRVLDEADVPVAFLENVTGILTKGAGEILDALAALGWDAEWGCYSAAEAGAPHLRDRWFALAYPGRGAPRWLQQIAVAERCRATELDQVRGDLADPDGAGLEGRRVRGRERADERVPGASRGTVANPDRIGLELQRRERQLDGDAPLRHDADRRGGWPGSLWEHRWPPLPGDADEWARWNGPQPAVRRDLDGPTRAVDLRRTDQLRLLGNGVVPVQAATAFLDLSRRVPA